MFVWMHGFPPTFKPQLSHFPPASRHRHTLHVHTGAGGVPRACADGKTRSATQNHADAKCCTAHGGCCRQWLLTQGLPPRQETPERWIPAADSYREGSCTQQALGSSQGNAQPQFSVCTGRCGSIHFKQDAEPHSREIHSREIQAGLFSLTI